MTLKKLTDAIAGMTKGPWQKVSWAGISGPVQEHIADCYCIPQDAHGIALFRNVAEELLEIVRSSQIVITNYNALHPDHAPTLGVLQLENAIAALEKKLGEI